ncbi:hypothetical protein UlMin_022895 [Ulmus minor]
MDKHHLRPRFKKAVPVWPLSTKSDPVRLFLCKMYAISYVYLAKLAEQAECYEEMITCDENLELKSDGYLTRSVEGKNATDIRLAAIAIGTSSRNNPVRGVTNIGLSSIARGCSSLKVLSLWNVPNVGDEGLFEIAKGCPSLEKLDLCQCPSISNKGLIAIADNCPNLTSLSIESCPKIGNMGLQAIGRDCLLVGDHGVSSLFSSALVLTKVKLQDLNITDFSIAVIGHYGKAITNLTLSGLQNTSERGFWVIGNAQGFEKLTSLTITYYGGMTDVSLEALGMGCTNLKQMCLHKCCFVSDNGLVAFAKAAALLKGLQLEECNRVTQACIIGVLLNCGALKSLTLVKRVNLSNCLNLTDEVVVTLAKLQGLTLEVLNLDGCRKIIDASLAAIADNYLFLSDLDLSKCTIIDSGLSVVSCSKQINLQVLSLSCCFEVTNRSLSSLKILGKTLVGLNLQHCNSISSSTIEQLDTKNK